MACNDTVFLQVCNDQVPPACSQDTVVFRIVPNNLPPNTTPTIDSTYDDSTIVINPNRNNTPQTGQIDPTRTTITRPPVCGTATLDPVTGFITYVPNPGSAPCSDTVFVSVCNNQTPPSCAADTVVINVVPRPNLPPNTTPTVDTTFDDSTIVVNPNRNNTPQTGQIDPTRTTITGPPVCGTATLDPVTGFVTYVPNPGSAPCSDTVFVRVCNDQTPAACSEDTIVINVVPRPNLPPVTVTTRDTTFSDSTIVINPNGNNTPQTGQIDPTSVTVVQPPQCGTVTVNALTGFITYVPSGTVPCEDTIVVRVCNDQTPPACANDTIIVSVVPRPTNQPPVTGTTKDTTYSDSTIVINPNANNTPQTGQSDPTSTTVVHPPQGGTITIDAVTGFITYVPSGTVPCEDTIIVNVCNDQTPPACANDTIIVSVVPRPNLLPVTAVTRVNIPRNSGPVNIDPNANNSDPDGNIRPELTTITSGAPRFGQVSINPTDGVLTYLPNQDAVGCDTITLSVCDDHVPSGCSPDTVIICISEVSNFAPVAVKTIITVERNSPAFSVNANENNFDPDGQIRPELTTITRLPRFGLLALNSSSGVFTYTPLNNVIGTDTITLSVCDNFSPPACVPDTVIIRIVEPAPIPGGPGSGNETARNVFIPRGFSPNGDGVHDRYSLAEAVNFKVDIRIYNRWGGLVYNKEDYDGSWDGTSNTGVRATGSDLPEGVYYAIIDFNNGEKPYNVAITLKR